MANELKQLAGVPWVNARLRDARTLAGLSQRDVEDHFGWPPTTVSRYERRDGPVPRVSRLRRLAELYGTSLEVLMAPPGVAFPRRTP